MGIFIDGRTFASPWWYRIADQPIGNLLIENFFLLEFLIISIGQARQDLALAHQLAGQHEFKESHQPDIV